MRRPIDTAVIGIVLLASVQAAATELTYVWRKDAVERYRYEETVHWKGGAILAVRAQLAERVRTLRADGRATVEVVLEELDASFGKRSYDLRAQVPAQEQRVAVVVDAKGHFAMPESWRVGVVDGRPAVEGRDAGSQTVEVVPRRLLGLLALPAGTVERGRAVSVTNGKQTMQWRLAAVDGMASTLYVTDSASATATAGHSATQSPRREAADLVVRFDTAQGRLLEVRGTLVWTQSTRVIARVLMQRVPPAPDYSSR
jgi:hypothetical protein